MDTEIIVSCCEWQDEPNEDGYNVLEAWGYPTKHVTSLEELPDWMRERIAVLRLLDEDVDSPMGAWVKSKKRSNDAEIMLIHYFIVPQPGDPKWEK